MRILVVEDHPDLAANIGDYLDARNHVVDYASDGVAGLQLALAEEHDAIILDVMLPRMDGLQVCKRLRAAGDSTPVLMLTARDQVPDKLEGFRAGTDDYMTKPFSLQELEARLEAMVRRARPPASSALRVADLELDLGTLVATRAGVPLELNRGSLTVLTELMRASPNVVSKRRLETALWGDCPPGSDALRTQMYTLRCVIDRPFSRPLLHTIRGIGYRLMDSDGAVTP